jgi:hypothetical protein
VVHFYFLVHHYQIQFFRHVAAVVIPKADLGAIIAYLSLEGATLLA